MVKSRMLNLPFFSFYLCVRALMPGKLRHWPPIIQSKIDGGWIWLYCKRFNNPFSCYMVWWKKYKNIFSIWKTAIKRKVALRNYAFQMENRPQMLMSYINEIYINFYSDPFMTNWPEIQTDFTGCPQLWRTHKQFLN